MIIKLKHIQNIVEKHLNISIDNKCRKFDFIFARSCYYFLCRKYTNSSFKKIANTLNKNHSTVIHSLKELPYLLKHNNKLNNLFNEIVKNVDNEYILENTKMTIDQLVSEYNLLLLQKKQLSNDIEKLEKKIKKLEIDNAEMKRIIYIMADTD